MDKTKLVEDLQAIVTGLSQQADGHELESIIFSSNGFTKLTQKYEEHATSERGYVKQCAQRIIDLGGKLENQTKQEAPVHSDPEKWLEYDLEVSKNGLAWLKSVVESSRDNLASFEILQAYYLDEEQDMYWAEQQLSLIKVISKKIGWLVNYNNWHFQIFLINLKQKGISSKNIS